MQATFDSHLLNVDFGSPVGETWSSIGGGETLESAIAAAREALPLGREWDVLGWNSLYGD